MLDLRISISVINAYKCSKQTKAVSNMTLFWAGPGGGEGLTSSYKFKCSIQVYIFLKEKLYKYTTEIPVQVCYDVDHGVMVLLFQLDQTKH